MGPLLLGVWYGLPRVPSTPRVGPCRPPETHLDSASVGLQLYHPYFLTLLAEAYGQAGQPEAGLSVLDKALMRMATTEERWWEAEVWRLKGEWLLRLPLPDIPQATACLHHALAVSRRQQAKALELARRAEPESAVAAAGQARRGARIPGPDRWLVHGGV